MKKFISILLTAIMIIPMCLFVGCEDFKNQGKGYEAILSCNYGTFYFCNGVKTLNLRIRCTSDEYSNCEERFNILRVRKYNRFEKVKYNYLPNDVHHNEDEWISVFPYAYYKTVSTEEFPDGIFQVNFPDGDEAPDYYMVVEECIGTSSSIVNMDQWGYKLLGEGFYRLVYSLRDKNHQKLDTFVLNVELYPISETTPAW